MSRKRIEIDLEQFKKLCFLQCTLSEIAGFFDCSEDTVERWCIREQSLSFADAFKKYSAAGKMSLRRTQFKLAEKSAAMAIFLGKNYLGQKDNFEYTDTSAVEKLELILRSIKENAADSETE